MLQNTSNGIYLYQLKFSQFLISQWAPIYIYIFQLPFYRFLWNLQTKTNKKYTFWKRFMRHSVSNLFVFCCHCSMCYNLSFWTNWKDVFRYFVEQRLSVSWFIISSVKDSYCFKSCHILCQKLLAPIKLNVMNRKHSKPKTKAEAAAATENSWTFSQHVKGI